MRFVLSLWNRIDKNRHVQKVTGSKITAFYAAMSLSYCFIQLLFLVTTWDVNHRAGNLLETILTQARMGTKDDFSYLETPKEGGRLRICKGISDSINMQDCEVAFPVKSVFDPIPVKFTPTVAPRDEGILYMSPLINNGNLTSFVIIDPADPDTVITLPPTCVKALKWPFQLLFDTRREDVTSACYQAWLLIMSCIAIFTQSIPHIGSTFMVHVIALGWSSFQLYDTTHFQKDYIRLITGPEGACNGIDLISSYFKNRIAYQIGVTTINFVSLLMSAYLTYRLVSLFGWATFKRMGASIAIDRAYKIALALSIAIQLSVFFYVASVGIFLDMLSKHVMGARPKYGGLYLGLYIASTIVVPAWLYLAWYGIRRESKKLMAGFFFLAVLYLAGSGGMFKSITFRQTFLHWPFLSAMFVLSYVIIIAAIVLAVFCQLNFGIGLPHYFERRNGEDPVDFHDEFHPTPDAKDVETTSYYSVDEKTVIAFPGATYGGYMKRSDTQSTGSSRRTTSSKWKTTIDIKPAMPAVAILPGRNLTPTNSTNSNSTTKPSWETGDDRHMWAERQDSTSSFGNKDASNMDRGFSVQTSQVSRDPSAAASSQVLPNRTPTSSTARSNSSTRQARPGLPKAI